MLALKPLDAKSDGSELDGFDDLTVSEATEAKFLKDPVSSSTRTSHRTPALIRQLPRTVQPLPAIVSINPESPKRHPGVLALPRELRDEIYKHVLAHNYRVNYPWPSMGSWAECENAEFDFAFEPPAHPRFQPPPPQRRLERTDPVRCTDTIAPWFPGAPGYDIVMKFEKEEKEKENDQRFERRWGLSKPLDHFGLIYASRATSKEATKVLYDHSTFVFSLNQPFAFILDQHTLGKMKKICIDVDLLSAYMEDYSTEDQASTLEACRRLLCDFGGTKIERTSCIINFHRTEHTSFILLDRFVKALKELKGFKTVVIKLLPPYQDWWEEEAFDSAAYPEMMARLYTWDIGNLMLLDKDLKDHLGPSTSEYMRYDFWCLIYHPRAHHTGSRPPLFNVDDLADPPELKDERLKSFSYLP